MIVEKTAVEGPLVEGTLFDRSTSGKTVQGLAAKNTVNKKLEDLNQELKTCDLCSDSSLFFSFSSLANCGANSTVLVLMHGIQYLQLWKDT